MKYIRTKDGIYTEKMYKLLKGFKKVLIDNYGQSIPPSVICNNSFDIVKQADTIKELCDEFVFVNEKEHYIVLPQILKDYRKGQGNVYGAIWTDKCLIYVAKMNDKGELELL